MNRKSEQYPRPRAGQERNNVIGDGSERTRATMAKGVRQISYLIQCDTCRGVPMDLFRNARPSYVCNVGWHDCDSARRFGG